MSQFGSGQCIKHDVYDVYSVSATREVESASDRRLALARRVSHSLGARRRSRTRRERLANRRLRDPRDLQSARDAHGEGIPALVHKIWNRTGIYCYLLVFYPSPPRSPPMGVD